MPLLNNPFFSIKDVAYNKSGIGFVVFSVLWFVLTTLLYVGTRIKHLKLIYSWLVIDALQIGDRLDNCIS